MVDMDTYRIAALQKMKQDNNNDIDNVILDNKLHEGQVSSSLIRMKNVWMK